LTPNPILTVLSTLKKQRVKCLLIGGQACIIYGAAEFSRDSDFVILSNSENLQRLKKALDCLKAELIYVPRLEAKYLNRGHACHFRCHRKDVKGLRIDVISKLRGCDPFDKLSERKNVISLEGGNTIDVLGLQDLVQSKKTQRDKDWLMLKRLVYNDIIIRKYNAPKGHILWWLEECRDPDLLIELVNKYPKLSEECLTRRPLLKSVISSKTEKLAAELQDEELWERQKDKKYWAPLRKELETLRHNG